MTEFLRFALFGLGSAAVYALSAVGVVIIYRGSGVVNFAQGGFALIGAYVYYEAQHDVPRVAAAVLAVVVAAAVGLFVEFAVMWPMRRSSALARVAATLGILAVITQGAVIHYGDLPIFVKSLVPTRELKITHSLVLGEDRLWLFAVAILLTVVLAVFFRRSRIGLATAAVAENQELASSLGWSPRSVAGLSWTIGAGLAGLSGVLLVPITELYPAVFEVAIVATLSAALVGGFRSFPLTLAGATLIAVLQSEATHYITAVGWTTAVPFLVIIAVLLVRGKALPLRSFLSDRLPSVGTGRVRPVAVLAALVISGGSVWVFGTQWTTAFTGTVTFAIVALSLVVVTGYAGQLSLAQYALAGIGALFAGRLMAAWNFPFLAAVVLGTLLAIPAGLIVALPALRARGVNLAVATLGLALVIESVVLGNPSYTGGPIIGTVVKNPTIFGIRIQSAQYPQRYAMVCLVFLALAAVFVARLRRRGAGRRLLAVRDNERAAASVGINVVGAKLYAFGVGAAIAALGGCLIALTDQYVDYSQFSADQSINLLLPTMIGGIGFVLGSLLGGVAVAGGVFQEIISHFFSISNWWILILGVLLVLQLILVPDGVAGHMAETVRRVVKTAKKLVNVKPVGAGHSLHSIEEHGTAPRVEPKVLDLRDVVVTFGGTTAIDGVSLVVNPGEIVGLIGPNGAGKTTLIDVATGFVKPRSGQVLLGGEPIDRRTPPQRVRLGLTRSWQSDELFEVMSVEENLRSAGESGGFATYFRGVFWRESRTLSPAISSSVRQFGLQDSLGLSPEELPHAARRLVGIARAVATEPSILLLDEPVAGLDEVSTEEFSAHIRRLARDRGMGILLVEHDVSMVMRTCDRVVAIDFGREITTGTPEQVRSHPGVIEAYLGRSGGSDARAEPPSAATVAVEDPPSA